MALGEKEAGRMPALPGGYPVDARRASCGQQRGCQMDMPKPGYHDPRIVVEIAGIRFNNPVIGASGTFGYGLEFAELIDLNKLGGFVTKGLSARPLPGNPPPRIVETHGGMLNAIGLQTIGARAFIEEKLPLLR